MFSLVLVLLLAATGCAGGKGTFSSEIVDETGAYKVTADDAAKDSAVGSLGGGITISENQVLLVSPDLEKGSIQLRLLDSKGDVAFDEEISGRVLSTYDLDPGEYSIGATCNENGTTGTMLVVPEDKNEFEKQNETLDTALSSLNESDEDKTEETKTEKVEAEETKTEEVKIAE